MSLAQLSFIAIVLIFGYVLWKRVSQIRAAIGLGRKMPLEGNKANRWQNVLLIALGQRKMFRRFVPAFFHLWIYLGFLIINLEIVELSIDGIAGTHRVFAPYMGKAYAGFITVFEGFAVAILLACIVFLVRRNILKVRRFWSAEMTRWPRSDANLILVFEIMLMVAVLVMNAADQALQTKGHYTSYGSFFFSMWLVPSLQGLAPSTLLYIERATWWFHIIGIFGFAIYVTYSKHLHIFMAFPNVYYARLSPKGHMNNMPSITREVKSMLGITPDSSIPAESMERLGAKDVQDLSQTSLIGAYACTECGRCTSECPAHLTGKKLSPRKIMMDIRKRSMEVIHNKKTQQVTQDQKTLLNDYITQEEINACTSCNACVEACPILINPLDIILELRRYTAMEESGSPAQWNSMFQNIETSFSPWKFAPTDRFNWSQTLKKPQ